MTFRDELRAVGVGKYAASALAEEAGYYRDQGTIETLSELIAALASNEITEAQLLRIPRVGGAAVAKLIHLAGVPPTHMVTKKALKHHPPGFG